MAEAIGVLPEMAASAWADVEAAFATRRLGEASRLLAGRPEMARREADALVWAARIAIERYDYPAATTLASEATEKSPHSVFARNVIGHALIASGRPLAAMRSFEAALADNPDDREARAYLAAGEERIAYRQWLESQAAGFGPGPTLSMLPRPMPLDGLRRCISARTPLDRARILSIHTWHDAAVTITQGSEILVNLELERFTRIKRDYGYREDFVRFCLDRTGLSISDIDLVCLDRLGSSVEGVQTRPLASHAPCDRPHTGWRLHVPFEAYVLGRWVPGLAVNHHVAHAAGAFFTSPFEVAPILIIDGGGDSAGTLSWGFGSGSNVFILGLEQPSSFLAQWWQHVTIANYKMAPFHQLDPGPGPGKVMALAAYGRPDPVKRDRLRAAIRFGGQRAHIGVENGEIVIRAWNGFLLDDSDLSDTHAPESQDWARALQEVTNDEIHECMVFLHDQVPMDALCYTGGVALNCIATSEALRRGPFQRIHVPPVPNDCGTALGMALYAYHVGLGQPRRPSLFSPYTGPSYTAGEIATAVYAFAATGADFAVERFEDDEALKARLVDLLAAKQILLMWRGRSECGPRALGHRSILCRPDIENIRGALNSHKAREWYRPFAPIVLSERAEEILEDGVAHAHYMTTSSLIREEWRSRLPGILHIDNSARPQVLTRELEPFLHDILVRLDERTGVPVLLNTSFNLSEPIVETPPHALDTWWRLGTRYLVLHDRILTRRSGADAS
jgi:carbamoyltransferase